MPRNKSSFDHLYSDKIRQLYVFEKKSIPQITEYFKSIGVPCNNQKIWRNLRSQMIQPRDPSTAQQLALKTGRAKHPTEGKSLSEENKKHLSESIGKRWEEISPEERQRRSEAAKIAYNERSDKDKRKMHEKAAKAVRKAAEEGSKLERFLVDELSERGYQVVFHKKGYIINENLEIDILLPAEKIAIEVDGVWHSKDIFGDLSKVKYKDNEKNGLLLSMGYVVIRLANTAKTCSLYYMSKKLTDLLEAIDKIKKEFPPLDSRLIFIGDNPKGESEE